VKSIRQSKIFVYIQSNWAFLLACFIALIAARAAVHHAMQPLLELHAFRQTQTALTSYWMIQEGWKLGYETPVSGYPWTIPFEFPIYQTIVAFFSSVFHYSLDATGRIVSIVFLLACAWPAWLITRKLSLKKEVAWVFCALLWSSPIYIFWGRTFMIETTAVFFTLVSIAYAIDLFKSSPSWRSTILFAVFSILGLLQKVTTIGPVLMVIGVLLVINHFATEGFKMPRWRKIACVAVSFIVPLTISLMWTNYTDVLKSHSMFGSNLTSKALFEWNFGTLAQRLDIHNLKNIFWTRVISNNAASFVGVFILITSLIFAERRIRSLILICLVMFILPIFIFFNLHRAHNYYQSSCALFLIAGLTIAVISVVPAFLKNAQLVTFLVVFLVGYNLLCYHRTYEKLTHEIYSITNDRTLAISDVVQRYTPENSGIVVFGDDWNSEIAYYSRRKSCTAPYQYNFSDSVWKSPAKFLGNLKLGAVVFVTNDSNIKSLMARPDIQRDSCLYKVFYQSYIWLPGVRSISPPVGYVTSPDLYSNVFKNQKIIQ